jgi:hypothetical protein
MAQGTYGFVCYCHPGYTGQRCETRDVCNPNPCQSGGQCMSMSGTFKCVCPPPYTGATCQTQDACSTNP